MLDESVEFFRLEHGRVAMVENRENMTVLLVDVSDSTQMYETLGDEKAFREVRSCLDLFEKAIAANGGRVAKAVGDGLICLFDEPGMAVAAGFDMQNSLRDRTVTGRRPTSIRIGLHCGPVLLGDDDVYGDTVRIATRMAQFAASGQIIVTGEIVMELAPELQNLTRHLDEFRIPGRAEDLTVHEVLWQEQDGHEYTQLPGRFEAMLAQAGITRLRIMHNGRDIVVASSLTIGRHASNEVVLGDRMASRYHARIERRKDKYVLVDLSSNGTFVAVDGGDEVKLRREELIMYGSGRIAFGHSAGEEGAETVGFTVE